MELIWPFGEPRGLRFGLTFATFSLILFVFYPISSLLMEFDVPSKSQINKMDDCNVKYGLCLSQSEISCKCFTFSFQIIV